jgi:hypothetical protein
MARSGANLLERMQFFRPRRPEEAIPRVRTDAHHAGKAPFQVAKFHCSQQRGDVSAEGAYRIAIFKARVECGNQEDGRPGERPGYRLRLDGQAACLEFAMSRILDFLCHHGSRLAAK